MSDLYDVTTYKFAASDISEGWMAMTTKHTPGPWRVRMNWQGTFNGSSIWSGGVRVCTLPLKADKPYDQKVADAALIAAGPDLLKAAQATLYEMRHTTAPRDSFTDAVDALDAAITKALGE
jgi:hypothetical protein